MPTSPIRSLAKKTSPSTGSIAPFDGTIIKKDAVLSQKADLNDVLFVLADLRTVWVTANVSESDVAKLPKIKDGTFRLSATAYPGPRVLGAAAFRRRDRRPADPDRAGARPGRESPTACSSWGCSCGSTWTAPRPSGPHGTGRRRGRDRRPELRVRTRQECTARITPSLRGPWRSAAQTGDRVVIKAGLTEGEKVVSSGSFLLKSELILQNQTDEEE